MGEFVKNSFPSVSIIIPVFNGMNTLPQCLNSIRKQDYPGPLEVIIVDDGSTDGSGEYAEEQEFKVIQQKNQGPAKARNEGARAATGDFLVFIDVDCLPDTHFTTELIRPLIGTKIVGSQGVFYSDQRNLVARFLQHEISERFKKQQKAQFIDWVATYGACYRKSIFLENGGFNEIYSKPSSEDVEFSIRLGKKGYKMIFAPKATCLHLHHVNFFRFLKFKYTRAYWTVWLYKEHTNRFIHDQMTPFIRKLMMLLMLGASVFLFLGIWWRFGFNIGLVFAALLLVATFPLSFKILTDDFLLGITTPFFLITRTICYIFGFSKGLIDYWREVRLTKTNSFI